MLEYQKKHKVRKLMYSKVSLVVLLVCITFLSKGVFGIYAKAQESEKNKQTAQVQYDKLVEREAIVAAQISELKTPEGIEKEIRSKFNVAKEGEQMVVIIEKEDDPNADTENTHKKGIFNKIKSLFRKDKKE